MTVRYHLAGTIDWGVNASWHDGVYGSSAVPVDNDSVYFLEGSDIVTGNVAGQSGIDLVLLSESAGFTGSVGTAGTPLALEATNTQSLVFNKGGNGRWNVNMHIPTLYMRSGYLGMLGGTLGAGTLWGGEAYINDQVIANGNTIIINGGQLTIDYKAGDSPVLTINGGVVYMSRLFGAVVVNAGRLVVQVMKSISASTSIVQSGGLVDYRAGYLTTYTGRAGTLTFENQIKPITFTNTNYNGVKVRAKTGGNGLTLTYTNPASETSPTDGGGPGV